MLWLHWNFIAFVRIGCIQYTLYEANATYQIQSIFLYKRQFFFAFAVYWFRSGSVHLLRIQRETLVSVRVSNKIQNRKQNTIILWCLVRYRNDNNVESEIILPNDDCVDDDGCKWNTTINGATTQKLNKCRKNDNFLNTLFGTLFIHVYVYIYIIIFGTIQFNKKAKIIKKRFKRNKSRNVLCVTHLYFT